MRDIFGFRTVADHPVGLGDEPVQIQVHHLAGGPLITFDQSPDKSRIFGHAWFYHHRFDLTWRCLIQYGMWVVTHGCRISKGFIQQSPPGRRVSLAWHPARNLASILC